MTNTVDEFVHSLVAATLNNEVQWQAGTEQFQNLLEDLYGNANKLYFFHDVEAGANVILAAYQYYEGEVEQDEFIKDGFSILLVDDEDFEVLNEVTDEDTTESTLFADLVQAIEK